MRLNIFVRNNFNRVITTILFLSLISLGFPQHGQAQMRDFEQNMAKMKVKLPPSIFDGKTLKITNYTELQQAKQFGLNYRGFLLNAVNAWGKLGRGQNEERKNQLLANKAYFDAFQKAYMVKAKEIKAPVMKKPVQAKQVTLADIYVGPGVKKKGPVIIDTVGQGDTEFKAYGHPGTKAKLSRWSALLSFYIKYDNIAHDDTVMIEIFKNGKKLREATACQYSNLHKQGQLAYYKCEAPKKRSDYKELFDTDGPHTIKLTYNKLIEGKSFKDFAIFHVTVKQAKQGAANNPSLKWETDHDMKLSVSTIEEEIPHGSPTDGGIQTAMQFAYQKQEVSTAIRTWLKKDKGHHLTKMTCLYHDKRIDEAKGFKAKEYSYWSYLKKGSMERNDEQWTQYKFQMKSLHPRPFPDGSKGSYSQPQHYLNENPGEYRCVVTGGGKVLKELFFRVGLDGEIVKPACQLESMNTLHTVTLLAAEDKLLSTVDYDKKIGQQSGFEGRVKWSKSCPPNRK